jgi:hypothetical protein
VEKTFHIRPVIGATLVKTCSLGVPHQTIIGGDMQDLSTMSDAVTEDYLADEDSYWDIAHNTDQCLQSIFFIESYTCLSNFPIEDIEFVDDLDARKKPKINILKENPNPHEMKIHSSKGLQCDGAI